MFTENLAPFFSDFATAATLDGASVSAIFDTQSVDELGMVTQEPSAVLRASQAGSAAPGQTFVYGGVSYIVRQVLHEPPDGATVRLVLSR